MNVTLIIVVDDAPHVRTIEVDLLNIDLKTFTSSSKLSGKRKQWQTIADGLTRVMKEPGLKRREKEVTLDEIIRDAMGEQDSDQHNGKDSGMVSERLQRINDELQLDKPIDLARRFMEQAGANGEKRR